MRSLSKTLTPKMLDAFYCVRLNEKLDATASATLLGYLTSLLKERAFPVYRGRWIDVDVASMATGITRETLLDVRPHLQPLCDASVGPPLIRKTTAGPSPTGLRRGSPRPDRGPLGAGPSQRALRGELAISQVKLCKEA